MSDLSQTILAGTEEMSRAGTELAAVRAAGQQRKRAAIQATSEALAGIGDTFKQFGSWSEAKKAEIDTKQVDDAYALGLATKGPSGALTTLSAYRPQTAPGSRRLVELMTHTEGLVRDQYQNQLNDAQIHHFQMQDKDLQDKIDERKQNEAERSKLMASGALTLGPDADANEAQIVSAVMGGTMKASEAKPALDVIRANRKRADDANKAALKTQKEQADTETFGKALAAYQDNTAVLDPATNTFHVPTQMERMAKVDAVEGLTPKHRQVIQSLAIAEDRLQQKAAQDKSELDFAKERFATQVAANDLRAQLEASGQDARAILAMDKMKLDAAVKIVEDSKKQLTRIGIQTLVDQQSTLLTDAEKAQRQKDREDSYAVARKNINEFEPLIQQIARTGGEKPAAAPRKGGKQEADVLTPEKAKDASDEELWKKAMGK